MTERDEFHKARESFKAYSIELLKREKYKKSKKAAFNNNKPGDEIKYPDGVPLSVRKRRAASVPTINPSYFTVFVVRHPGMSRTVSQGDYLTMFMTKTGKCYIEVNGRRYALEVKDYKSAYHDQYKNLIYFEKIFANDLYTVALVS